MEGSANQNPWPLAWGLTILAVVAFLGGGFYVYASSRPEPVAAPSKFAVYKASDNSFKVEYPDGWNSKSAEAAAVMSQAAFAKGGARIFVTSDLTGSLIADATRIPGGVAPDAFAGMPNVPGMAELKAATKAPIDRLHDGGRKEAETLLGGKGYEEGAAKPIRSKMGDGRISEFTVDRGLLLGKAHGYRATFLGTERAYHVLTYCPEDNWKQLDKAFARVLGSLSP